MTSHVLLNEELRTLNATRANHEEGGSEVLLVEVFQEFTTMQKIKREIIVR